MTSKLMHKKYFTYLDFVRIIDGIDCYLFIHSITPSSFTSQCVAITSIYCVICCLKYPHFREVTAQGFHLRLDSKVLKTLLFSLLQFHLKTKHCQCIMFVSQLCFPYKIASLYCHVYTFVGDPDHFFNCINIHA